jgi:hypothetical protein
MRTTTFVAWNFLVLCVFTIVYYNMNQAAFNIKKKLSFFEAAYFSIISHTTLGYGDIYPVSIMSRLFVIIHVLLVFFLLLIK